MANISNRKSSRLWLLVSRKNLEFLNEAERCNDSPKYSPLVCQNYIPSFVGKSEFLLHLFFYLVSVMIFFRLIFKTIAVVREKIQCGTIECKNGKAFLLTSTAMPRIAKLAKLETKDAIWIKLPGSKIKVDGERVISSVAFVQYKHILWSFCDAIISYFYILRKKGYKYGLEAKGGFDWLLFYWALQKLGTNVELHFCDQIDHWISLIDRSPQRVKIHLQHGTIYTRRNMSKIGSSIYSFVKEYNIWAVNSPYKMSYVKNAYSFSQIEYAAECKSFFKVPPEPIIMGYPLRSTDLTPVVSEKKSVMIIGYYYKYYGFEKQLISYLQDKNVEVILKNHPTVSPDKYALLQSKYSFRLVNGSVFPKTDIVLSYDSTLAKEYEGLDIDVIYYDDKPIDEVMKELSKRLSEI